MIVITQTRYGNYGIYRINEIETLCASQVLYANAEYFYKGSWFTVKNYQICVDLARLWSLCRYGQIIPIEKGC